MSCFLGCRLLRRRRGCRGDGRARLGLRGGAGRGLLCAGGGSAGLCLVLCLVWIAGGC